MKTVLSCLLLLGLIVAGVLVVKGLASPAEPSALSMHPSNYKKPLVEQISLSSPAHARTVYLEDFYRTTEETSGYVTSQGVKVFYQTFGSGAPLLIINGGPGMSSEGFIPLAKEMAQGRQTILFDQRGTGHSTIEQPNSENITMDLMIQDMEAIRQHLKIHEWTIMGHSFGGMLAGYYAAKHPSRVKGLVFSASGGLDLQLFSYLNITGRLTQMQQDSLQYWTSQISQGDTSHHAAFRRGLALAPAYLHNKKYVPVIAERLTQGNRAVNELVFQDMRRIQFDCKSELRDLEVPALIIQGAQDVIGLQTAQLTKETLQHSEIIILPDCGHYGWLDQKEAYFQSINKFLASLSS